jgi:hypothetical protein
MAAVKYAQLFLLFVTILHKHECARVDLSDLPCWLATGVDHEHKPITIPATVPGDIYTDALKAGIIGDPYLADNDLKTRWLGESNWTYSCVFVIPQQPKPGLVGLMQHGLDTISTTRLNGQIIAQSLYNLSYASHMLFL